MLAGALEDVVKASQLEIIELQHTVSELRYLILVFYLPILKFDKQKYSPY